MKRRWGWRGWRRIVQAVSLVLFVYLAARTMVPQGFNQTVAELCAAGQDLRLPGPLTLFFDLDPLAGLGTILSTWTLKTTLLLSLAVLLAAMVMGRAFCGFICPFGALQQAVGRLGLKRKASESARLNRPSAGQRIKFLLLIMLLFSALLGANQTGWLDPLSFLFRGLALGVFPAVGRLSAQVSAWLAELPQPFRLLSYIGPYTVGPATGHGGMAYQGAMWMGGLLVLVLALGRFRPRFFCRVLCPLGALLGLFARFGVLNLTKDPSRCTDCGRCRTACPGASGPHPDENWLRHECHVCFNCQAACPEGALRFRFQFFKPSPDPSPLPARDRPDLGRRAVLASLAGGLAWVGLSRSSPASPAHPPADLVRPPGALAEEEFLKRCIRCGLCMRVCPTNAIQPALAEGGWEGLWSPRLVFNLGYCEYECTLCSSVCPTGAIRELTGREKIETPVRIGSAFIDRGRCLPWSGQGPCLVCEEHCPTSPKAIYLTPTTVALDRDRSAVLDAPQISLERCVGCGVCVYKCPVRGRPAVYVHSVGESRSSSNRILLPENRKPDRNQP